MCIFMFVKRKIPAKTQFAKIIYNTFRHVIQLLQKSTLKS